MQEDLISYLQDLTEVTVTESAGRYERQEAFLR